MKNQRYWSQDDIMSLLRHAYNTFGCNIPLADEIKNTLSFIGLMNNFLNRGSKPKIVRKITSERVFFKFITYHHKTTHEIELTPDAVNAVKVFVDYHLREKCERLMRLSNFKGKPALEQEEE